MTAPNTTTISTLIPQDPAYSPGFGPGQPKTLAYQASDFGQSQINSGTAQELLTASNDPTKSPEEQRAAKAGFDDMLYGYDASEPQEAQTARRAAFVWAAPSMEPAPLADTPAQTEEGTGSPLLYSAPTTDGAHFISMTTTVPVTVLAPEHVSKVQGWIAELEAEGHLLAAEFRALFGHA